MNKKRKKVGTKLFVGTTELTFGMFLSFFQQQCKIVFSLYTPLIHPICKNVWLWPGDDFLTSA